MTAAWVRPVDGAGIWHLSPTHPRLRLTYLGAFVVSFLLLAAFLGAVSAGRHGMCAVYKHRPNPPSYCHYTGQVQR